jgi:mono/diheme cytochrome c family protein
MKRPLHLMVVPMGVALAVGLNGCASAGSGERPAAAPSAAAPAAGEHATTGSAPMDWPVPPEEAARVNPLKASEDNLQKGSVLFNRHCTACHGTSGRGDGPMAEHWQRLPKDLTHPDRQARMSDGEIFWKLSVGHRQNGEEIMPALGYKLSSDERWRLVLFVRSLVVTR